MNNNSIFQQCLIPRSILLCCISLVAACSPQGAQNNAGEIAADEQPMRYPDWHGQWQRGPGSLNWPSEGYEEAGPPPLNDEYMAIWQGYTALQEAGIPAGDPPSTCLPQGMPRIMKMTYPMEIIVTPDITYIYAEWNSQFRRIYTDGRDWPDYILPAFNGYSIGEWHDENNDGEYDMLSVETRAMKGPRSYDSRAVPLHANNQTVVKEEIRLTDDMTMVNTITTIDDALTEPWTVDQVYLRELDNIVWAEYACAENNLHLKLGDEWYFINQDGTLSPTREGQPGLVPDTQN